MADYDKLDLRNKKYYVKVNQYGSSKRFKDCTYSYFPEKNELHVVISAGLNIKFIGNFSAEIMSMEDWNKNCTHD